MMTIYLGTRLLFRQRSMLNALGAAALGIMIVDPRVLLGASFQMTFLSVFIIAGIGAPLLDRLSQPYRRGLQYLNSPDYDLHLAPRVAQFRLDLRMVSERLALFLPWRCLGERMALPALAGVIRAVLAGFEVLFISSLMQLGLALPMAFYFHRAAVVGVPANALVVPLTGVLMPTAVLAVALGYVSPLLARIPALAAGAALEGIAGTVHSLGGLRVADLRVATPELPAILCAMAALAIAMILARSRAWLAGLGLTMLLGSALWLSVLGPKPRLHPGMLEMTAIDVGQGDSILLVSPLGKMLLVDAGGPVGEQHSELDFGEDVVSPYLWSRGISRLDAVALTHGHSDHMGGMHAVIANFRPRELWLGALPPSQTLSQLLRQAKEQNITVIQHFQGDTFAFGGATVRVLAPARDWRTAQQPRNNDSLVLHVSYRESSVLMEGDTEKRIEERISALQPHADVLKVAHHGGATSSIPDLLQAVRPRMAVISVGARNSFGHPRMEVLQRFEELGVATYRTDLDGAVTFYLDGRSVNPAMAALR